MHAFLVISLRQTDKRTRANAFTSCFVGDLLCSGYLLDDLLTVYVCHIRPRSHLFDRTAPFSNWYHYEICQLDLKRLTHERRFSAIFSNIFVSERQRHTVSPKCRPITCFRGFIYHIGLHTVLLHPSADRRSSNCILDIWTNDTYTRSKMLLLLLLQSLLLLCPASGVIVFVQSSNAVRAFIGKTADLVCEFV